MTAVDPCLSWQEIDDIRRLANSQHNAGYAEFFRVNALLDTLAALRRRLEAAERKPRADHA